MRIVRTNTLLLVAEAGSVNVAVDFMYDTTDPLAITLQFHTENPVIWCFARDLLIAGLRSQAGQGDVRVYPIDATRTGIELHSPSGRARFEAPTTALNAFLQETLNAMPQDCSMDEDTLDRTIAQLLS